MNVPFLPKLGFSLIVALSLMEMGCASSPAYVSPKTEDPSLNNRKQPTYGIGDDSRLIGIWQGYWSLKGRVETDRYLFLEDGRWGWLATAETNTTNAAQPVQRSGRWELAEGVIVLTELRRRELVGCQRDLLSDQTCEEESRCKPCNPAYRVIRHDTPVIERLAVDECPDNQEAEKLDREYTCISIGDRVFWRKAIRKRSDQDRFFEED